jgi:hypothetical protein
MDVRHLAGVTLKAGQADSRVDIGLTGQCMGNETLAMQGRHDHALIFGELELSMHATPDMKFHVQTPARIDGTHQVGGHRQLRCNRSAIDVTMVEESTCEYVGVQRDDVMSST